jgi:hypothetical protein
MGWSLYGCEARDDLVCDIGARSTCHRLLDVQWWIVFLDGSVSWTMRMMKGSFSVSL